MSEPAVRVIFAAILSLLFSHVRAGAAEPLHKTPLTSVGAVTDLDAPRDMDDPGTGGGMDMEAYFHNRLLPKLDDCTEQVRKAFKAWTDRFSLKVPHQESKPGEIVMHATKAGLKGFFELIYRVDGKRERARVTVSFYSADGARHEPLGIQQMLKDFSVAELQGQLDLALQCGSR